MRRNNISASAKTPSDTTEKPSMTSFFVIPDGGVTAIGGKDHYGRDGALEGAVEVREALDVQHVDLKGNERGE